MKELFYKSKYCQSRKNCRICRSQNETGDKWRERIRVEYRVAGGFPCIFGFTAQKQPKPGQKVAITSRKKPEQSCKFKEDTMVQVNSARPCMGNWIKCNNPINGLDRVMGKFCDKIKCKFYRI